MYQPQRPMIGAPQPMFQQPQMPRQMPMQAPQPMQGGQQQGQDPMAALMANPMVMAMLMRRQGQSQGFNPAQVRPQEQQVNAVNSQMGTSDPMAQGAAQVGGQSGGIGQMLRSLFGK